MRVKLGVPVFLPTVALIWTLAYGQGSLARQDNGARTPEQTIEFYYDLLARDFGDGDHPGRNGKTAQVSRIVEELFDAERLASQLLQKSWGKLNEHVQNSLVEALKISLQKKIFTQIEKYATPDASALTLESKKRRNKSATLSYSISGKDGKTDFNISMLEYPDGSWKISSVKAGKNSLLQNYYRHSKKILEKYSVSSLVAELAEADYVILEDFEGQEVGKLPKGWQWKKTDNKKNKPYRVIEEGGNKYLAAEDNGESVILGKEIKWDLKKYPYISFRWRVHKIPAGGDERYNRSVDSAAGIYVTYKKKLGLIPESVKYVWSTTLPVGSAMKRSGIGRPWMVVVNSGEDDLGEWRTYVFNAYEAYKKTFGGKPPDKPVGIGLLSDANSTHSQAYADYDDIRALKHADADSGVYEKLKAE